jgi:hypothetical protein
MQSIVEIPRRNIIITLPTEVIQLLCGKDDEAEERATLAWTCSELRAILLPRTPPAVMVYVAIRSLDMDNILLAYSMFGARGLREGLRYSGHKDDTIWVGPGCYYMPGFTWSPHPKMYAILEVIDRYHLFMPILTLFYQHLTYGHDSILAALKMTIEGESWEIAETLLEYANQEQQEAAVIEALRFKRIDMAMNMLRYMEPERATNLAWDITSRAVRNIDLQMLRNILAADGEVYDRFQIDQDLVDGFKPLLYLAELICDLPGYCSDFLKIWKETIAFSDVQDEDDGQSNVLHILAQHGAHQFHRMKLLDRNPDEPLVEPAQSSAINTDKKTTASSDQDLNEASSTSAKDNPGLLSSQTTQDDWKDVEDLAGDAENAVSETSEASEDEPGPSIDETYRRMIRSVLECQQDGDGNICGADLNHQDVFGSTPLHLAVAWYEPILVEILLEKGADCCIEDEDGNFAWDLLNWNRDRSCIGLARALMEKAFEQLQTPVKAAKEWCDSGPFITERDDLTIAERLAAFALELEEFETATV